MINFFYNVKTTNKSKMEKKKSSIEWLVQEFNRNIEFIPHVNHWDKIRDIIQQAKAMHKEEIKNAYDHHRCIGNFENGEQYHNETFNKQ